MERIQMVDILMYGLNRLLRSRLVFVPSLFACGLVVLLGGCGDGHPTRVPVAGVVLIDGEPLKSGNIKFVPKNGRPSASKIGSDGRFNLTCYDGNDGALLGIHRVQISANRIISDSKIEWYAPQQYADFRTSGIEVDVSAPVEDLKIELRWGAKKGPYVDGS